MNYFCETVCAQTVRFRISKEDIKTSKNKIIEPHQNFIGSNIKKCTRSLKQQSKVLPLYIDATKI